jgi:hypothetical protein
MAVVGGREIAIRKLNETQIMLIMREGSVLRSNKIDTERRMKGVATILDIVESSIEDPDDLEFLMKLVSMGKVEFPELLHLVSPEAEEAPKAPVRRAARKR